MPVITFDVGHLTREQKAELVREFANVAHKITGIRLDAFVTIIRENDLDNIGSGDQLLSDKMKQP